MKKTVLRINDLNARNEQYGKLKHVSCHIMESEITGLLGLNYSGKELLVQILLGNVELNWQKNNVYVDGKKIQRPADVKKYVYHIDMKNHVIDSWTVAEYIGLSNIGHFMTKKALRKMRKEVQEQFAAFGIALDIEKRMGKLTELERREVETLRASRMGARILIIEDECDGMNPGTIESYAVLLKKVLHNRMAAIFLCHSNLAISILSDQYIIFRKGRVVKKGKKDLPYNNGQVNDYLLGNTMMYKKQMLDSYTRKINAGEDTVYGIRNIAIRGVSESFDFKKGEITTFSISNNRERVNFFMAVCGRQIPKKVEYLIENYQAEFTNHASFINAGIVSLMRVGKDCETFEKMSVGDNLLIPSIKKLSNMNMISNGKKISEILSKEIETGALQDTVVLKDLSSNDHISVALNRWYVFNPRVIVLYDPFTNCDAFGVAVIMSYIKKFSDRGTVVIVIKSNLEYMEGVSDRIYDFE